MANNRHASLERLYSGIARSVKGTMIYLARESAGHGIFDSIKKSSPSEQKMLAHEQKKREEQDKVRRPAMSQEKSRGCLARRLIWIVKRRAIWPDLSS